jgi:hypothetical protein
MSDFLFVTPSFTRGLARTLDVGAVLSGYSYNVSPSPAYADAWATAEDWSTVGKDLAEAINEYRAANGKEKAKE